MKLNRIMHLMAGLAILAAASVAPAQAARILLITYDYGPGVYDSMEGHLESGGHAVDQVSGLVGGDIAAALSANTYDQVFLYDLTPTAYLGGADLAALASFWNPTMGLVVDSRAYGNFFNPDAPSEVALIQNVANQLQNAGGGVWVGTDDSPLWAKNGNAFLGAIGVNPVTGIFSNPVNFADPTSVLLSGVTPADLWFESLGQTPLGIQPNGIEMFTHFGHITGDGSVIPYISASFPLEGAPPTETPEPGTVTLMVSGLAAFAFIRRRRKS